MSSRETAIKTILTADDTKLKAAFGNAASDVQRLGRELQDQAKNATTVWGRFQNKIKDAAAPPSWDRFASGFSERFATARIAAKRFGEFAFEKIRDFAREIPEFVEKADNIGKSAQKLGVTTEAFQRLSYAMNLSDVSAETFEGTFKKLNMGLGQLKTMGGPIESGLKKLNPQLMMTLRKTNDSTEAFLATADAIKKTVDPAKRAAIAQAVFGKQGQELLPILLQGREGITALMKETEKYGEILSGDTIEAAGKFQDAQKRLTASFTQIKGTILSTMVTSLEPFISKMAEWVSTNKELIGTKIQSFITTSTSIIEKLAPLAGRLFETLGPTLLDIITKLSPVIEKLADLIAQAAKIVFGNTEDKHSDIGVLEPILGGQAAQDKSKLRIDAKKQLDEAFFKNDFSKLDQFATEQLIKDQMDDMRRKRITSFGLPFGFGKDEGVSEAMSKLNPQQQQWAKNFMAAPNAGALGVQNQLNNNIKVEVNGVPGAQVKVTQNTGQETSSAGRTAPAIPMTRRGGDLE